MKIVICDRESAERASVTKKLRERLGSVVIEAPSESFEWSETEVIQRLNGATVLVTAATPITERILKNREEVAYVVKTGVGVDNIAVDAATDRGILVTRTPGVNDEGIAEHVIGMFIALNKNMLIADRRLRDGNWDYRTRITGKTRELLNKTIGIVGLGTIGRRLAEIANCIGMDVLAYDPYVGEETAQEVGATLVAFDELLSHSRFVSLNCLLTEETHHLIGEAEFEAMDDQALLVNTSRGPVVDESALVSALENGEIAGAGIDVFETEPPDPDNPLFDFENVIVTPHISGTTYEGYQQIGDTIADDIVTFLDGEVPDEQHIVNPSVLEEYEHPLK